MPKRPPVLNTNSMAKAQRGPRERTAARGYGGNWQRVRLWHLAHHPLCEDCNERGLTVGATEVDHVERLCDSGDHSEGNLRSLCKSCHSRKTVREDGGLGRPKAKPTPAKEAGG